LLIQYYFPTGGHYHASAKRALWNPFTYDRSKYKTADKPINIEQGYKNAYYRELPPTKNRPRKLVAVAYRDGTSSTAASLVLSTYKTDRQWDLVHEKLNDYKWYFNSSLTQHQHDEKAFPFLCGEKDPAVFDIILDAVTALSTGQGKQDWFLLRGMSLTSTQAKSLITELAKTHYSNSSHENSF